MVREYQTYEKKREPIKIEYLKVLSEEIPDFLYDYINTPIMQRAHKVGQDCGTYYTKLFNNQFYYSILDHSIGAALIVWKFTKDRKQTLSTLFHDISTPVFKHCIDFLNGDYEKQESTEGLTTQIIANSTEIMELLERDGIKLEEVCDYKLYPIADNHSPRLSADRLESTLSCGIYFKPVWGLKEAKEIYDNIEIFTNEDGVEEIGFKDILIAKKFTEKASRIWNQWMCNKDKITMQFVADIVKKMIEEGHFTLEELYVLTEEEVIEKIENCPNTEVSRVFNLFRNATQVGESDTEIKDKYCVSIEPKKRYINPLVRTDKGVQRIYDISNVARIRIDRFLAHKTKKYVFLDFNF